MGVERKAEMPKTKFGTDDGKVVVHIHMPNSGPATQTTQRVAPRPTASVQAAEHEVERQQAKVEAAISAMSKASTASEIKAAEAKLATAEKSEMRAKEKEEAAKESTGTAGAEEKVED